MPYRAEQVSDEGLFVSEAFSTRRSFSRWLAEADDMLASVSLPAW
jgi:hypothetical protein